MCANFPSHQQPSNSQTTRLWNLTWEGGELAYQNSIEIRAVENWKEIQSRCCAGKEMGRSYSAVTMCVRGGRCRLSSSYFFKWKNHTHIQPPLSTGAFIGKSENISEKLELFFFYVRLLMSELCGMNFKFCELSQHWFFFKRNGKSYKLKTS